MNLYEGIDNEYTERHAKALERERRLLEMFNRADQEQRAAQHLPALGHLLKRRETLATTWTAAYRALEAHYREEFKGLEPLIEGRKSVIANAMLKAIKPKIPGKMYGHLCIFALEITGAIRRKATANR